MPDRSLHRREIRGIFQPRFEAQRCAGAIIGERPLLLGDGALQLSVLLLLFFVLEKQQGWAGDGVSEMRIKARLIGRVEEGEEPAVLFLGDLVKFVVVTT